MKKKTITVGIMLLVGGLTYVLINNSLFIHKASINIVKTAGSLTCNYPWGNRVPTTHRLKQDGKDIGISIGYSDRFGGVGTEFKITDKKQNKTIDILESRSAAGSGWQFTSWIKLKQSDARAVMTNQAAGNSAGYQWGISHILQQQNLNGKSILTAQNWATNYPDMYQGEYTTPCSKKSKATSWYSGKPKVRLSKVGDNMFKIDSIYSIKPNKNYTWNVFIPWQAFYMNREVARKHDLTLYVFGDDWMEGPFRPYEKISYIGHGAKHINYGWDMWKFARDAKYMLLTWTVGSQKVGVIIDDLSWESSIRINKVAYCKDPNNDKCGSIDVLVQRKISVNETYEKDKIYPYKWTYYVGTLDELKSYGFKIPVSKNISNQATITASRTHSFNKTSYINDGNMQTMWNAGAPAPQYVLMDFRSPKNISSIRLHIAQKPAGQTTHKIYIGTKKSNLTLFRTISQYTKDNDVLFVKLNNENRIRYIKIETTQSPSWVAWKEIEVF